MDKSAEIALRSWKKDNPALKDNPDMIAAFLSGWRLREELEELRRAIAEKAANISGKKNQINRINEIST